MLVERKHQPDILEVISDLSSDEKFTPPSVANAILDLLPDEVWDDPTLKWLDPGCKTGVFLREAAKRLLKSEGMKAAFPDEDARLEHILTNMLHGLAITELTALMSRRTLYCSKDASSAKSAAHLACRDGNVWFQRTEHSFAGARCHECGAVKERVEREGRENYAYSFIHEGGRKAVRKDMDMHFDVIIGNPPYQMNDGGGGGGSSAVPLYNLFVEQALELQPRYIAMVIPSRWMAGGRGLDDFRASMLSDRRIRTIVDFQDATHLFPGINLNGGASYFLWDRTHDGECEVTSVQASGQRTTTKRALNTYDVFVRLNEAVPIVNKVTLLGEPTFDALVSVSRPFGFRSNFEGKKKAPAKDPLVLYGLKSTSFVTRSEVMMNKGWIDKYKVLMPKATDGNEVYPLPVLVEPIIAEPGSVCTETYLAFGPFDTQSQAEACAAYLKTRFFRFLLSLRKITQNNSRDKFRFIPQVELDRTWTDEDLYARYSITEDEQAFIAKQIRGWGE